MWQRRQLKAQRRRAHGGKHATSTTSSSTTMEQRDQRLFSYFVVAVCLLIAAIVTLKDNVSDGGDAHSSAGFGSTVNAMVQHLGLFLVRYPHRFYAFYAPKIERLTQWMVAVCDTIEIPDDISEALDFTVALVVVASVFHIIDTARRSFVATFQTAPSISNTSGKEEQEVDACDAF